MITADAILRWMWGLFGLYWLVSALGTKKVALNEKAGLRILRLATLAVMLALLLTPWLRVGLLARRFIPKSVVVVWLGVAVAGAGIALAIWARRHLGENWSDKVVLKVDHQLIRSGPYGYLRHPIYTGVLLGVGGTALAIGEWRGIVALLLQGTSYLIKAKREERILAESFGEAFAEYKRETGFFLPGL
jgi:protein-S-isoprenylcysteine O-methyltransferase Ste14